MFASSELVVGPELTPLPKFWSASESERALLHALSVFERRSSTPTGLHRVAAVERSLESLVLRAAPSTNRAQVRYWQLTARLYRARRIRSEDSRASHLAAISEEASQEVRSLEHLLSVQRSSWPSICFDLWMLGRVTHVEAVLTGDYSRHPFSSQPPGHDRPQFLEEIRADLRDVVNSHPNGEMFRVPTLVLVGLLTFAHYQHLRHHDWVVIDSYAANAAATFKGVLANAEGSDAIPASRARVNSLFITASTFDRARQGTTEFAEAFARSSASAVPRLERADYLEEKARATVLARGPGVVSPIGFEIWRPPDGSVGRRLFL